MWCAALPCARDFDARLDGTAVWCVLTVPSRAKRYHTASTRRITVVTTYPVNNINLIYSTRFPFSFEPCSRFSFQMYHRSLIPDVADGKRRTAAGPRTSNHTPGTSDPVIVTIISNRICTGRGWPHGNAPTQAELEARSFPIVRLSRATSDVRLSDAAYTQGRDERHAYRTTHHTRPTTSHHLLRSSVQASIAHAMICK